MFALSNYERLVTFTMTPTSNGDLNRMPFLKLKNPGNAFRDDSDCKSVKILDYTNYKCVLDKSRTLQLGEITNFGRGQSPCGASTNHSRCVMCGVTDAAIPTQNKNVCKACDSVPWLLKSPEVVVKFCKGCKNFAVLGDFTDKPGAAKCGKCRLRSRNNYLKSKKSACVATKKALSSESAPSQIELVEIEPDVDLGETICSSSSLSMLVVTDSHNNSKFVKKEDFEETGLLSTYNDDGNTKTNKNMTSILTPSLLLGPGDSPFPNLGSGVSCGSTYNPSCNYNTNRAKLLNAGWRLPCLDPGLPIQNQSVAVNFNSRGGIPRPSSALAMPFPSFPSTTKPSPPFTMSPFCAYFLAEACTDKEGNVVAKASDVNNSTSPPLTPQQSFTSPSSSHLVDRWHWDRELNPLMQLVMATESIAPQSPPSLPFPFPFPSGSIYTQRKRKMSSSEGSKNVSSNDLPDCSASLDKSETKHGKKYRNSGTKIKSNEYAESPKSSCTLNLDWERMEFIVDRESNLILSNGEENVSAEVLEEVEVEPQITAKALNATENGLYGIRENDSHLDTAKGVGLDMRSDSVDGTLTVTDVKQKGTGMEDSRDLSGPALNDGGSEPGLSRAALYSAVSGCFRELSRRHSKGTGASHPLPKNMNVMTGFSVALMPSLQPRSLHLPLSLPLPEPPSHNAPQSHCATVLQSSSSSISLCNAPLSMTLPLCALPTAWSLAPHPSSSSLLSPSQDAIKETTHYCDDDEVVHSYEGDAYCEQEKKRKPYPYKILSPMGTGKENECPQSIGSKGLKCLKKSKASSTDSKRNILGPIRVAELGSTDTCADISSNLNIDTAHSALAVSQECSSRSSELAFAELEQWYLKWKFVLHPTN